MEARVMELSRLIVNEVMDSIAKHGDWSNYTPDEMSDAVFHEWLELMWATDRHDITGLHGMIRESIQVCACLVKSIVQWETRMILYCEDGHEWFGMHLPAVCPHCLKDAIGARSKR